MTISAKIIADSVSPNAVRLTTFELEYPRFILAEVNTHRMLSKNSASSRAIPVERANEMIEKNPSMPVHWGKAQSGMSADHELEGDALIIAKKVWLDARDSAVYYSKQLAALGLAKQLTNRITEAWATMKSVVTGTEWANLLWLRNHDAAQPEFHALVELMAKEFEQSEPTKLEVGEWHLPYVDYMMLDMPLEDRIKISASCCAQVSYRRNDDSIQKAIAVYDRLVGMDRLHASPFEHQGTPIPQFYTNGERWPAGVTHLDRNGQYWSGNFKGWIQLRKTLENENHTEN